MRRCPECFEAYLGSEKFCENDGAPLLEVSMLPPTPAHRISQTNGAWVIATFGVVVGVAFSLIIGAFVFAMLRGNESRSREDEERIAVATQRSTPTRPAKLSSTLLLGATPLPSESPTLEAEEESSEQTAAPVSETTNQLAPAPLNKGPVSTNASPSEGAGGQTLIRLKDGTQVEVDAAWEEGQGIWYKRGALITYVERSRVEAITQKPQPEASPTPTTP